MLLELHVCRQYTGDENKLTVSKRDIVRRKTTGIFMADVSRRRLFTFSARLINSSAVGQTREGPQSNALEGASRSWPYCCAAAVQILGLSWPYRDSAGLLVPRLGVLVSDSGNCKAPPEITWEELAGLDLGVSPLASLRCPPEVEMPI